MTSLLPFPKHFLSSDASHLTCRTYVISTLTTLLHSTAPFVLGSPDEIRPGTRSGGLLPFPSGEKAASRSACDRTCGTLLETSPHDFEPTGFSLFGVRLQQPVCFNAAAPSLTVKALCVRLVATQDFRIRLFPNTWKRMDHVRKLSQGGLLGLSRAV